MIEVIGVRFSTNVSRVIYFKPNGQKFNVGDQVIAEAPRGLELGDVAIANKNIDEVGNKHEIFSIVRRASDADLQTLKQNKEKEVQALQICAEKIKLHELEMDLISAHYTFDRSKILFYFTADGRVDFRDLVKTLASVFRTRIELRQVGVRDKAKILGGIGICGRTLCCGTFMRDFEPVSVKMAKEQGLSLNPAKISGCCGRLMCCLKYEQVAYDDLMKTLPGYGAVVEIKVGGKPERGVVENMYVLRGLVKIKLEKSNEHHILKAENVKVIKKGTWRQGDENTEEEEASKDLE
ncbi:MAG: stage 0 sporulation family protein [Clostridiales bacterium]|jgi:cell fate regulator YaaT (PSP1 superfamily)|nr:stage 0 sporulation family protein [Clostridiales bacterium]